MTTHTPTRQMHHRIWEIGKYMISLLILGAGVGIFFFLKSLAEPAPLQDTNAQIQQVDTYEITPYAGVLDRVVSGTVVPHREIKVAAEVGGKIKTKYPACETGNFVTAGEKLLEIDPEEYQIEIETIQAEVVQAQKRIKENQQQIAGTKKSLQLAQNDLELQRQEYRRNQRLRGVMSQAELEQSKKSLNRAESQLVSLESNLRTLEATGERLQAALDLSQRRLEKSRLNLKRTVITAPDDGVIVRLMVEKDDYVNRGMQVLALEDTKHAEVLCSLTPHQLDWIRTHSHQGPRTVHDDLRSVYRIPKTHVSIFDPENPSHIWQGILERFDGIGRDDVTKTIPCRIVVKQPIIEGEKGLEALVRGMYVKCRIEVDTTSATDEPQMFSFPAEGLYPGNYVWVVRNKKLKRIDVDVIDWTERLVNGKRQSMVIVRQQPEGLRSGDRIVVSPLSQPTDDAPVQLSPAGATP